MAKPWFLVAPEPRRQFGVVPGMSYRAEVDALLAEERSLELELAEVSRELAATEARKARQKELVAALRKVGRQVAHAQGVEPKQRSLPLLHNVRVASPCKADWDGMTGDSHVRHCGLCDKNVYNLSALTRQDAEALLLRHENELCVRFYRRADGKVMTSDCGPGSRRRRRRRGVALATALGAGAGAVVAMQPSEEPPTCEIDPGPWVTIPRAHAARQVMGRVGSPRAEPRATIGAMSAIGLDGLPPEEAAFFDMPSPEELEAQRRAEQEAAVDESFEALIQRTQQAAEAEWRAAAEDAARSAQGTDSDAADADLLP